MVLNSQPIPSTEETKTVEVLTLSPIPLQTDETMPAVFPPEQISAISFMKAEVRQSLKASTWDGVFAALFGSITSGVLLNNFLLQLGANPIEIGMLASIPMVGNLLQPLGAYLAEKTTSRRWYGFAVFATSRLLWLLLALGMSWAAWHESDRHFLVIWTLGIVLASTIFSCLGAASWLSWMAAIVPQRLRGRYFGLRNSLTSLVPLISIPLLGVVVSAFPGGSIAGYGLILWLGVFAGILSLLCQGWMKDVNPQIQHLPSAAIPMTSSWKWPEFLKDSNYLRFLFYFSFWAFAVNLGAPFFNLYLLDNLQLDVSWVTVYNSLMTGAALTFMMLWGKLADRWGNRPLLILVGLGMAVMPLFWLLVGDDDFSRWLWLPLLHLAMGGMGAAIDLCANNLLMGVAPIRAQSTSFAITAAAAGVTGALSTTVGGFLAQSHLIGGLLGLFALSAVLRLIALLPLVLVREPRSKAFWEVLRSLPFSPTHQS